MSIAVSNVVDSCVFQNVPGPSFRAAASSSSCWALWRLGNEREAMLAEAEDTVQLVHLNKDKAKFVQRADCFLPLTSTRRKQVTINLTTAPLTKTTLRLSRITTQ
jgi:hypothetical protein